MNVAHALISPGGIARRFGFHERALRLMARNTGASR